MDNTIKEWHVNSGYKSVGGQLSKMNQAHMIKRNLAYIGFGRGNDEYTSRSESKGFTTPKQFEKFKKNARKGDKIYLYQNRKGYIHYGYYTGMIYEPGITSCAWELAPGWGITEIQKHIQVDKWVSISNPAMPDVVPRVTLVEIK